ncbi:MAG: LytTR family DNA-binding domain-containing protein, partial [Verrucomicrobia bacterium]|nr:LytTR family DNA-binding domain-containing protein [Verrucomicrobiota bacterium]
LAAELAPAQFFRVNRNYLVHASAVKSFSSLGKGRLTVQLLPRPGDEVLVSQESNAAFRAWLGQ